MNRADDVEDGLESSRRRAGTLGSDIAALAILTAICFLLGSLGNALRSRPLPWMYRDRVAAMAAAMSQVGPTGGKSLPMEDVGEPTHEISLDEFQKFVADHAGLVLDARPMVFYREAHVPGAVNLPTEAFAEEYPRLRETLEPHKGQPVAIYCSGPDCPDSQLLADALGKLGFRRLRIYTSGWEEWSQTGLPQESTAPRA